MPKKLTEADTKDKWNFYVSKLMKAEYYKTCLENSFTNQSAILRALMQAFIDGKIDCDMLKTYYNDQIFYTPQGKTSKL